MRSSRWLAATKTSSMLMGVLRSGQSRRTKDSDLQTTAEVWLNDDHPAASWICRGEEGKTGPTTIQVDTCGDFPADRLDSRKQNTSSWEESARLGSYVSNRGYEDSPSVSMHVIVDEAGVIVNLDGLRSSAEEAVVDFDVASTRKLSGTTVCGSEDPKQVVWHTLSDEDRKIADRISSDIDKVVSRLGNLTQIFAGSWKGYNTHSHIDWLDKVKARQGPDLSVGSTQSNNLSIIEALWMFAEGSDAERAVDLAHKIHLTHNPDVINDTETRASWLRRERNLWKAGLGEGTMDLSVALSALSIAEAVNLCKSSAGDDTSACTFLDAVSWRERKHRAQEKSAKWKARQAITEAGITNIDRYSLEMGVGRWSEASAASAQKKWRNPDESEPSELTGTQTADDTTS